MATVQLSDVIIPAVYTSYQAVDNIESSAFVASGVVQRAAVLDQLANGPSNAFSVPYWKDLDQTSEVNYGNDDPTDLAVPEKLGTGQWNARKAFVNKGWSAMNLVNEMLGASPMQEIRNRTGRYFQRQFNRRIIAIGKGLVADNIAGNGGDMGVDVSIADGVNALAANLISRDTFVNAAYTLGDMVENLSVFACHSVVMSRLVKNEDIVYIPDSKGQLTLPTYLGRRVVVDDTLPVAAGGTSGFVYTSLLYGSGVIGFGKGSPTKPMEVESTPAAGNGAGQETLWERNTWLLHPYGYQWVEGSLAEASPTLADLALATHWTRALTRKDIPFAWLKTNG